MADADPTAVHTHDLASDYFADDGTDQADLTSCMTDGTTGTGCNVGNVSKIGKAGSPHGDCMRIDFDVPISGLAAGDTVTIYSTSVHATSSMELLPYDASGGVTITDRISLGSWGTGANVFTLTDAFIGQLFDQDSPNGAWACRMVNTAWGSGGGGDVQVGEVEADLTSGPPAGAVLATLNGVATISASLTNATIVVSEQEGYRWRDDDDNEADATFLAAQDTNVSIGKEENIRLRMVTDYANDPDTKQLTLQYRKVGDPDSEWEDV